MVEELPILLVPALLAHGASHLASGLFFELSTLFFLLFHFGDMINCLADREVDAVCKTHLSEAIQGFGVRNVTWQIGLTVRHRIDRAGYARRRFGVRLGPLVMPFPNPGWLPLHDLHHVALDLPPTGTPTFLIAFLCASAVCLGALLGPRRAWRAWRRHRGAVSLYTERYEELVTMDLDALRRHMHIIAPSASDFTCRAAT